MTSITVEQARKVIEVVDHGLCKGLGSPEPGKMCVEAAVCYALGMPHSDSPECVGEAVRAYKIGINDAYWPSNAERASGLRDIAVAQLGSKDIDQVEFSTYVAIQTVRQILPIALRQVRLEAEASACEQASCLESAAWSAESAAKSAESAAWWAAKSASAAWSAAESAESAAKSASAAESAAESASESASAAWSAAESAKSARLTVLRLSAKIGVDALRHCGCIGVQLMEQVITHNK